MTLISMTSKKMPGKIVENPETQRKLTAKTIYSELFARDKVCKQTQ